MLKRIRELLGKRKKPTATAATALEADSGSAISAATVAQRPPVRRGPTIAHHAIPQADLDPDAVKIVRRLTRFDHRAYLVGGCVRDLLLHRRPKDFDVGTSATPRQMKRLFRNCRIIGRRFRLAHIYFQHGKIIEVATFRARDVDDEADAEREDLLIREDNVFGTPEEDALRRDFTINSLFYDVNEGNVIDHADGLTDLRQRLVRTIGDPTIRFREDPVRMLRAVKFAARLEFKIESRTVAALRRARWEIQKSAPPRILEEIARFGREGAARRSFELLRETELLDVILPEVATECAERRKAWELVRELFEYTDRERHGSDRPIRLGETFAVLLLPMLVGRFGWNDDGTVEPPQGVDLLETIDDALRPMAARLRIPRREQEYCRQILSNLQRVVTGKRIRGGARRALQRKDCYPDVLWMLGVVAGRYQGAIASAFESWSHREPDAAPREAQEDKPARRRRRRRGSRGRGKPAAGERTESAPHGRDEGRSKSGEEMPSKWDDEYFFAALPTLPEEGEKPEAAAQEDASPAAGDDRPAAPQRRRRRRRRRRPGGSGSAKPAPSPADAESPSGEGTEED